MLLKACVHGRREEKLDTGLGLVDGRGVDVSLACILHVALNALFDLHNNFAG